MFEKNFMLAALEAAQKAFQRNSVPVGAVIVSEDQLISRAGNEVVKNRDATAHAEMLAIRCAEEKLGTAFLTNCDIYVTLEPCAMCAQAISLAKIRRLYFGAYDTKFGAVEHNSKVLDFALHKPEIIGGVMEKECAEILEEFFQKLRNS